MIESCDTFGPDGREAAIDDPELRYAAVRLCCDLALRDRDFVRDDGCWVLQLPPIRLDRLEYQLEICDQDGRTSVVCDPGNPRRAPGAFGENSVVSALGLRAGPAAGLGDVTGSHRVIVVGGGVCGLSCVSSSRACAV